MQLTPVMAELPQNIRNRSAWRRLLDSALAVLVAAPCLCFTPATADEGAYTVVARWQTGNTALRPVTYENGVVFAAGESALEAWDTEKGERLWAQALDSPADFRPRLAGDAILVSGRAFISAFDQATGQPLWSYRPGLPVGAPLHFRGRIYVGVGHLMTALDMEGEIVWSRSTQDKKAIWYGPASFGDDTVLFGPGDGKLYALDAATGDVRWILDQAEKWQYLRQLHISGATVVAGGYKDNIFGIDARTGKPVWDWYSGNFINSHLVYGGVAYLWSPTGWVYALDAETGVRNWRTKSDYFPRKDGKRRPWAPVMAELVADDRGLYILDMKDVLHILDHVTGKEYATLQFKERLRPYVALIPGSSQLILGTPAGELLHVELKFM